MVESRCTNRRPNTPVAPRTRTRLISLVMIHSRLWINSPKGMCREKIKNHIRQDCVFHRHEQETELGQSQAPTCSFEVSGTARGTGEPFIARLDVRGHGDSATNEFFKSCRPRNCLAEWITCGKPARFDACGSDLPAGLRIFSDSELCGTPTSGTVAGAPPDHPQGLSQEQAPQEKLDILSSVTTPAKTTVPPQTAACGETCLHCGRQCGPRMRLTGVCESEGRPVRNSGRINCRITLVQKGDHFNTSHYSLPPGSRLTTLPPSFRDVSRLPLERPSIWPFASRSNALGEIMHRLDAAAKISRSSLISFRLRHADLERASSAGSISRALSAIRAAISQTSVSLR